jgi:hypothetical protein
MANLDYEKYFGKSRAENYAKAQLKKELILKFLYEETFSDSRTLAALLDLGTQSTNQTLVKNIKNPKNKFYVDILTALKRR